MGKMGRARQKLKDGALREVWRELRWLYRYVSRYRTQIVLYTAVGLAAAACGLGAGLASRRLINQVLAGSLTGGTVAAFAALGLLGVAIGALSRRMNARISLRVTNEIRADVFRRFLDTGWEDVLRYHSGDLLTRVNSDVTAVADSVLGFAPSFLVKLTQFLAALGVIFYFDPAMALLCLVSIPLAAVGSRLLLGRMRRFGQEIRKAGGELTAFFEESLQNIQSVKAFALTDRFCGRLETLQRLYYDVSLRYNGLSVWTTSLLSLLSLLVSWLCLGWGVWRLWGGVIDFGTMVLFVQLAGILSASASALINAVPSAVSATVSAGRIMTILDLPREPQADGQAAQRLKQSGRPLGLRLEHVTFAYRGGPDVLRDVAVQVEPGQTAAFVGPSGGGKTTLLRLLLGLTAPQAGSICVFSDGDSVPVSPATRRLFTYVPQEKAVFTGAVADMLRLFAPDADDERLRAALRAACAEDFVDRLPNGLQSDLGERGAGLSEGQCQRLSIARAILSDAPVLLLDEATSALDADTEREVLRGVLSFCAGKTLVIMTHRQGVLPLCDRVWSIRDGGIAVTAAPNEVL